MTLDPVLLSRLQFAWVAAWHILLPAFTVALRHSSLFWRGCTSLPSARSIFGIVTLTFVGQPEVRGDFAAHITLRFGGKCPAARL